MDVTRMPTSTLVTDAEHETLVRGLAASRRLVVLLVYEGALVPLAPGPDGVAPDDDLRELLRALGTSPGVELHVLSGHRRDVLERWMGDLPVALHAEHGFWSRPVPDSASGAVWTPLSETQPPWKIDLPSAADALCVLDSRCGPRREDRLARVALRDGRAGDCDVARGRAEARARRVGTRAPCRVGRRRRDDRGPARGRERRRRRRHARPRARRDRHPGDRRPEG